MFLLQKLFVWGLFNTSFLIQVRMKVISLWHVAAPVWSDTGCEGCGGEVWQSKESMVRREVNKDVEWRRNDEKLTKALKGKSGGNDQTVDTDRVSQANHTSIRDSKKCEGFLCLSAALISPRRGRTENCFGLSHCENGRTEMVSLSVWLSLNNSLTPALCTFLADILWHRWRLRQWRRTP